MSWTEGFKDALLRYVQRNGHPDATEILYWDEDITRGDLGGCDTCGYGADDPYELRIYYKTEEEDSDYSGLSYFSDRPFGELLDELIRQES